MNLQVELECPYCANKFVKWVKFSQDSTPIKLVVLCDIDDTPGCDRYFAVIVKVKPMVEIFKMVEVNE